MENTAASQDTPNNSEYFMEHLRRKRPNSVKLDIERMFQQSIELTQIHNKLIKENKNLQKQYQKVEEAKGERQLFISAVEKIVKSKSEQIGEKNTGHSSWLIFKLHKKIDDLKNEVEKKDKAIQKLRLSKENQILYRKEIQLECLEEIIDFTKSEVTQDKSEEQSQQQQQEQEVNNRKQGEENSIKDIVWMQDHLKSEQEILRQLESELEQEERQTKKIMMKLAFKKNQLKKLKEVVKEYNSTQEKYRLEKKKKEEKIVGNKSYLIDLMKQRDGQLQKMEQLKRRYQKIEQQEEEQIQRLQKQLKQLKDAYENNKNQVSQTKEQVMEISNHNRYQQWVKRVTLEEIKSIARNINYDFRLKKISQFCWINQFFKDGSSQYSIGDVIRKLKMKPFGLKSEIQCKLLARYVIEDQDQGIMLEDMETSQSSPIIKSILMKLVGQIKIYKNEQIIQLMECVGEKLSKFSSLVEQAIQLKQGNIKFINEEKLKEGIEEAQLEINSEELEFTTLYLFSLSGNIQLLEISKLKKLKQNGIRWKNVIQNEDVEAFDELKNDF